MFFFVASLVQIQIQKFTDRRRQTVHRNKKVFKDDLIFNPLEKQKVFNSVQTKRSDCYYIGISSFCSEQHIWTIKKKFYQQIIVYLTNEIHILNVNTNPKIYEIRCNSDLLYHLKVTQLYFLSCDTLILCLLMQSYEKMALLSMCLICLKI